MRCTCLSEALERSRGLLRRTPTHGFFKPIQLNMFIDRLRPQTKQLLNASAGGKIKLKTPEEATELIENMSTNDHAFLRDRTHQPIKKSLLELSSHDALLAQNKLLSKQLEILTETLSKLPTKLSIGQPTHSSILQVIGCTICGEAYETDQCIPTEENTQEIHYMGNQQRKRYTQGGFSGFQQEKNPKEECKAVMTRSERFVEAEDEDSVVHKKKIADNKGTHGKKNEVRGESNQEKEEQIMVKNKELKDHEKEKEMASRKRARTDDIPSSSNLAPPTAAMETDAQHSHIVIPMLQMAWPEAQLPLERSHEVVPPCLWFRNGD
ncbi:hypothetical protein HKD37_09G025290 [Glycine soja]